MGLDLSSVSDYFEDGYWDPEEETPWDRAYRALVTHVAWSKATNRCDCHRLWCEPPLKVSPFRYCATFRELETKLKEVPIYEPTPRTDLG